MQATLLFAFDVRNAGAVGDGTTLETEAIQRAIDACAATGGTVVFPPGRYLSGTLFMRSHVTLHLCRGATLLGSPDVRHFPVMRTGLRCYADHYCERSLIHGESLEHVGISGEGIIDGQGGLYEQKARPTDIRPMVVRFSSCRGVRVEGITLQHSPNWLQRYFDCRDVWIRGVRGFNHANYQNDFLDIDSCRDVVVSDCIGDSDDDGITLKSGSDLPCENITITNCIIGSNSNAFKCGTESNGGFRNITVNNLVVRPAAKASVYPYSPLAALALMIVDGGVMENVSISNVVIDGAYTPIFVRLGHRGRPHTEGMEKPGIGRVRNVNISNVVTTGASLMASSITGISGHAIENVSLSNINITSRGGGPLEDCDIDVPEKDNGYPDCHKLGKLPAYGFFCRHVRGLHLDNVRLYTQTPDARHAFRGDDVTDLRLERLSYPQNPQAGKPVHLTGCEPHSKR